MTAAAASGPRREAMRRVVEYLNTREPGHPLRVGIDGVCGCGKTTFARELTTALAESRRAVVYIDSDGFHHTRARRYRQGRHSARGYYDDAYDLDTLADRVLRPLGPGGDRRYPVTIHDLHTDEVRTGPVETAPADAVALFACTFIQRDALRDMWDEVIYLDADVDVATAGGIARDARALGGVAGAAAAYAHRYEAACRMYLEEQNPRERASILIEHSDPSRPRIQRLGPAPAT